MHHYRIYLLSSLVVFVLVHIVDVTGVVIVIHPVVELYWLDSGILAAFFEVCSPFGQCSAHLVRLVQVVKFCEIVDVDTWGMLQSILYVVIAPILAGFLIQKYFPAFTRKAVPYLPAFSTLMITAVVAIVVSHNASKLLTGGLVVVLVVVLHNLSGLGTGYLMGRILGMSEAKRRAISIEVGMQNSGLATSLAALHFAAYPMATIPGAVFSVWHNISGALVARLFTARKETQT